MPNAQMPRSDGPTSQPAPTSDHNEDDQRNGRMKNVYSSILLVSFGFLLLKFSKLASSPLNLTPRRKTTAVPPKTRILYIITTSSEVYGKSIRGNRIKDIILPLVKTSVESLIDEYHVDVFLISAYIMSPENQKLIASELPAQVGLEVWDDAVPLKYNCDFLVTPLLCSNNGKGRKKDQVPPNQSILQFGSAQLARQHRLVVKDKFPYYDFFMAFEDDMLITKQHIEYHMSVMTELNRLKEQAPHELLASDQHQFWGALTKKQLERMRPGFIRVEALVNKNRGTQQHLEARIPVDLNFTNPNSSGNSSRSWYYANVDPEPCCHSAHVGNQHPKSEDLLVWETGILGTKVREMPESTSSSLSWVALLPGPARSKGFRSLVDGIWSCDFSAQKEIKPPNGNGKYLAQSAGWMASRSELQQLEGFCPGGFLPPYDPPQYLQDGLFRNNVEFWSGGIQLYMSCNIQRILSLVPQDFSRHLLYHTANNKQTQKGLFRLVRINDLLGQLNTVHKKAEAMKQHPRSSRHGF
jgi:hypothetical protein